MEQASSATDLSAIKRFRREVEQAIDDGIIAGDKEKAQLMDYVDQVIDSQSVLVEFVAYLSRFELTRTPEDRKSGPVRAIFRYRDSNGQEQEGVISAETIDTMRRDIENAIADIPKVQRALTRRRGGVVAQTAKANLKAFFDNLNRQHLLDVDIIVPAGPRGNGGRATVNVLDTGIRSSGFYDDVGLIPTNAVHSVLRAYALNRKDIGQYGLFLVSRDKQNRSYINGSYIIPDQKMQQDLLPLVNGNQQQLAQLLQPFHSKVAKQMVKIATDLQGMGLPATTTVVSITVLASHIRQLGTGSADQGLLSLPQVQQRFPQGQVPQAGAKRNKQQAEAYRAAVAPVEQKIVDTSNALKGIGKGMELANREAGLVSPARR